MPHPKKHVKYSVLVRAPNMRIADDTGGTFTDVVFEDDREVRKTYWNNVFEVEVA